MIKNLLFLLFPLFASAQIPVDYYLGAENYADGTLKFELNQIIDNHIEFSYTSTSTDVWDILKDTDRDPNNPDNVILIYSGVSINGAQEYNSTNGWTREHVWAKSRGDFGTTRGPGTDVHALRPLDANTNSTRSNRGFDNCITCVVVLDKWGNDTNSKRDLNDWSFEPKTDVKGDVARMIFYMAVRYEGYDGYPDLEMSETILPTTDKTPFHGILTTLLEWNRLDPVDAWEENRNDIIYYDYQDNRNPFIDHPEIAEHLWGTKIGINWPEMPLGVDDFNSIALRVYPNPTTDYITISGITNDADVAIFDTLGRQIAIHTITVSENRIDLSQLTGVFFIKITSDGKTTTKRVVVI